MFLQFQVSYSVPSISLSQIQRAHIFRVRYSVLKYLESDTACSQVFRVRPSVLAVTFKLFCSVLFPFSQRLPHSAHSVRKTQTQRALAVVFKLFYSLSPLWPCGVCVCVIWHACEVWRRILIVPQPWCITLMDNCYLIRYLSYSPNHIILILLS